MVDFDVHAPLFVDEKTDASTSVLVGPAGPVSLQNGKVQTELRVQDIRTEPGFCQEDNACIPEDI